AMYRAEAFAVIARTQAEAGDRAAARKALEKALAAANGLPAPDPTDPSPFQARQALNARSYALQKIAEVQAALGDARAAEQTLAALPEEAKESKQFALHDSKIRAGDFKAARKMADSTPPNRTPWDMWEGRDRYLAVIAIAQARAKDFKAAAETLGQITQLGSRIAANVGVARELARAGQKERAAHLRRQAVPKPETVGPDKGWSDDMREALRQLAATQAEIGAAKAAREWIAKLPSPFTRSFVLLGVIEGLAATDGSGPKVLLFDVD